MSVDNNKRMTLPVRLFWTGCRSSPCLKVVSDDGRDEAKENSNPFNVTTG